MVLNLRQWLRLATDEIALNKLLLKKEQSMTPLAQKRGSKKNKIKALFFFSSIDMKFHITFKPIALIQAGSSSEAESCVCVWGSTKNLNLKGEKSIFNVLS